MYGRVIETGEWIDADSFSESASGTASTMAVALVKSLKAERSKVIFLDVRSCQPGTADDKVWCQNFQGSLESLLIKNGIKFLPETATDEIRRKIADEQVYQHNSMQVDVQKAVELGQQKAFQAFLSVSVSGDGKKMIQLSAQAINIKEGVVSISENKTVHYRQERSRSWGTITKGWLITGTGLGLVAYGLGQAYREGLASEKAYDSYKEADNSGDASTARRDVEKHDKKYSQYMDVAGAGTLIAIAGGIYFLVNGGEEAMQYKVLSTSKRPSSPETSTITLRPEILPRFLGLSLALEW